MAEFSVVLIICFKPFLNCKFRIIDVSTVKELAKRLNPGIMDKFHEIRKKDNEAEKNKTFCPEGKHTAKYDIYNSISEMKFYQDNFLIINK